MVSRCTPCLVKVCTGFLNRPPALPEAVHKVFIFALRMITMESKNWLLLLTMPLLFAGDAAGFSDITEILSDLRTGLSSVLTIAVYVGVILAAVLYGASQLVPDPQERAKFQSWAWGAVLGAIGALLINVIGGWIIERLEPTT